MSTTLSQQLDEFLAGWKQRMPPERQAWSAISRI